MKRLQKFRIVRKFFPGGTRIRNSEAGFSLLEIIIATALLGIIGLAVANGLVTSTKILFLTDVRETAKNLAEAQMEYVKGLAFASSYAPQNIPAEYTGFSVDSPIVTSNITSDGSLQKIIIVVRHNDKAILHTADGTLEGYKVR